MTTKMMKRRGKGKKKRKADRTVVKCEKEENGKEVRGVEEKKY